jgi:lactate dehydrogenase-like 2-hydroxyacid dehydrogenase
MKTDKKAGVVAYSALPQSCLDRLKQHFDVADFTGQSGLRKNPDFMAALAAAQGVIGSGLPFDRALIAATPQLKVVSTVTVGYDNYDVAALSERGILLCNTPDVLTESVADLSLALMLASARRVVELGSRVAAGEWKRAIDSQDFGSDIYGKTLGIVGMGRIGMSVARRANLGFGMRVLYQSRHPKPDAEREFGARHCSLDELLTQADFVCVLVPLSAETERLIGAAQFAKMKRSAFFINVARGKVVDETAMIEALRAGQIAGAGLDVFEREPLPLDSGLRGLPNVVLLPHIGSATHQTRLAMAELATENLVDALSGDKPRAMVNQQCWPLKA